MNATTGVSGMSRENLLLVSTIDSLGFYARQIEDAYRDLIDADPVCGWFAMWCEIDRRAQNAKSARHQECRAFVEWTLDDRKYGSNPIDLDAMRFQ